MMHTTSPQKRLSGKTVLVILVGFFAIVIGMNALMASYALGTFDGTTEDDAYRKGLGFNERIAAQADAADLGWSLGVSAKVLDEASQTVRIDITPEGVEYPAIDGQLWRQTAKGMDVALPFVPAGDGTYSAVADLPALGRWELRVTARKRDADVRFRQTLMF
ncbi:MAG: FixH family protein [Pseudomonadota bacterium]